jgi:hypothetical protein
MKLSRSCSRGVELVLLIPALLVSGCGGSDEPDASAANGSLAARATNDEFDPCALVTTAEAAAALGVATAEADRPAEANTERRSESYSGGDDMVVRLRTCRYTGELGQAVAVLTVMVRQSSSSSESEIGFAGLRQTYEESGAAMDMPGLGQQAFWIDTQPGVLQVLDRGLQLSISGDVDSDTARDLAARALERLN